MFTAAPGTGCVFNKCYCGELLEGEAGSHNSLKCCVCGSGYDKKGPLSSLRRPPLPLPTPNDVMCQYLGNIPSSESPRHGNEASEFLFNLHFYKSVGAVGHPELFRNLLNNCGGR